MNIPNQSSWETKPRRAFPKLAKNLDAEIVIIGGGLAGMVTAYFLRQQGAKVAVIEKDKVGRGVTAYTTAFITQDVDTDFLQLVSMFGKDTARAVWQSGMDAIESFEKIIAEHKIDCEFQRCNLYSWAASEDELKQLEEERAALTEQGFKTTLSRGNDLGFSNAGHLIIPNQAKFHPIKFLDALIEIVAESGVQIFENTEVSEVGDKDKRIFVKAGEHGILCDKVLTTTYFPFDNPKEVLLKKGMYVSYVFEARLPKDVIQEGLYQDQNNPYHYFRVDKGGEFDRLIIGGEDHRKEIKMDSEKNYSALREYAESLFGKHLQFVRRWHGPILEPSDGLALIGAYDPNKYVATAFSGNGMTYSMLAGMMISDWIVGKANPYLLVYDPSRIPTAKQLIKKGGDYIGQFFGGAAKNILRKTK